MKKNSVMRHLILTVSLFAGVALPGTLLYANEGVLTFSPKTSPENILLSEGILDKYYREWAVEGNLWSALSYAVQFTQNPIPSNLGSAAFGLGYAALNSLDPLKTSSEVTAERYQMAQVGTSNRTLTFSKGLTKQSLLETIGIQESQIKKNIANSLYLTGASVAISGLALPESSRSGSYIAGGLIAIAGLSIQANTISNIFNFERNAIEFQNAINPGMTDSEKEALAGRKLQNVIASERAWRQGFAVFGIVLGSLNSSSPSSWPLIGKGCWDLFFAKGPVERMMTDYDRFQAEQKATSFMPELNFKGNEIQLALTTTF